MRGTTHGDSPNERRAGVPDRRTTRKQCVAKGGSDATGDEDRGHCELRVALGTHGPGTLDAECGHHGSVQHGEGERRRHAERRRRGDRGQAREEDGETAGEPACGQHAPEVLRAVQPLLGGAVHAHAQARDCGGQPLEEQVADAGAVVKVGGDGADIPRGQIRRNRTDDQRVKHARRLLGQELGEREGPNRGAELAEHADWPVQGRWQQRRASHAQVADGPEDHPSAADGLVQGHLIFRAVRLRRRRRRR
mmetsp:Transcript_30482/g.87371  ORF Transcript_30482/g.87371 Transcript_30482/m.87371 type:complete len:250 (-) Transcript_30482:625-1374(-)